VPYRIDVRAVPGSFDRLIELGAIDAEILPDGGIAAVMPDTVAPKLIANALQVEEVIASPAVGRDADSVWVLTPRSMQIGRLRIAPAGTAAGGADALMLVDSPTFGSGLHPTTAMCLEALDEALRDGTPDGLLDIGTGSGVLALGALKLGVPRALAIDLDDTALRVAAENARINALGDRLELRLGGPETVAGAWPLVVANVLAAPLVEMAPAIVRRVGHHGQLVLSGIASSLEPEVDRTYRGLGMHPGRVTSRAGWVAIVLRATW
jgi:ribosomal protein L11 methyltransferase